MTVYSPEAQAELNAAEAELSTVLSTQTEPQESSSEIVEEITSTQEDEARSPSEAAEVKKKKGQDFVKVDDPQVKERIDFLYLQAKSSDEKNRLLLEQNAKLQEVLQGLSKDVSSIKSETRQKQEDTQISQIKNDLKEAWSIGDFDKAAELNDTLLRIAVEQNSRLLSETSKAEEKSIPKPRVDEGAIKDAKYVDFLANEKDETGNLRRPYLQNWHPKNDEAAQEAAKIATEFSQSGRNLSLQDVMKELDRRMVPSEKSSDGVLSSNRNSSPKKVVNLSQQERVIAKKMGISESDWIAQKEILEKSGRG